MPWRGQELVGARAPGALGPQNKLQIRMHSYQEPPICFPEDKADYSRALLWNPACRVAAGLQGGSATDVNLQDDVGRL
jgi:hypothetical protein